jgi:regulator of protease activity HflC (stomatin/prohibitin superfamily)
MRVRQFGPGWVFWWPLFHTMTTCVTVRQVMPIQTETLQTKDGQTVIVGGVVTYTITDVHKYLAENYDADDSIHEITAACLREVVTDKTLEELMKNSRQSVDNALTKSAASLLEDFGVTVERMRITSFAPAQVINVVGGTPGRSIVPVSSAAE